MPGFISLRDHKDAILAMNPQPLIPSMLNNRKHLQIAAADADIKFSLVPKQQTLFVPNDAYKTTSSACNLCHTTQSEE